MSARARPTFCRSPHSPLTNTARTPTAKGCLGNVEWVGISFKKPLGWFANARKTLEIDLCLVLGFVSSPKTYIQSKHFWTSMLEHCVFSMYV